MMDHALTKIGCRNPGFHPSFGCDAKRETQIRVSHYVFTYSEKPRPVVEIGCTGGGMTPASARLLAAAIIAHCDIADRLDLGTFTPTQLNGVWAE